MRQRDGGRARKHLPPKVTLETMIGTTTTQAGHEPAKELAVLTVTGLASTTDPDGSHVAARRSLNRFD
jgi:hypothetical protein